jgi:uncharacterized protein YpiB (UPF0302 family)
MVLNNLPYISKMINHTVLKEAYIKYVMYTWQLKSKEEVIIDRWDEGVLKDKIMVKVHFESDRNRHYTGFLSIKNYNEQTLEYNPKDSFCETKGRNSKIDRIFGE